MSKYSRTKGHGFERACAQDFRELGFNCMTKRQARGGDWETSDDGIDLAGTDPFAVQVKRLHSYVSVNTIEEIKPFKDQIPLVITKADRKPAMCILPWDEMKKIIKQLN